MNYDLPHILFFCGAALGFALILVTNVYFHALTPRRKRKQFQRYIHQYATNDEKRAILDCVRKYPHEMWRIFTPNTFRNATLDKVVIMLSTDARYEAYKKYVGSLTAEEITELYL